MRSFLIISHLFTFEVILTDETSDKTDDLEVNEESSSVSNETFIASVSVTRKKSTPIVKRARPVSKRKVCIHFSFVSIICFV